jgi:septum site-determining protein MinD
MGIGEVRLIVNRIGYHQFRRLGQTVDEVIDAIGAQLIGLVEEDEAVYLASNTETPLVLFEDKRAARAFLDIARRITGENLPLKGKLSR